MWSRHRSTKSGFCHVLVIFFSSWFSHCIYSLGIKLFCVIIIKLSKAPFPSLVRSDYQMKKFQLIGASYFLIIPVATRGRCCINLTGPHGCCVQITNSFVHKKLRQRNFMIHTTGSKHWLNKIKATEDHITQISIKNTGNKQPGRNPADVKALNCQLKATMVFKVKLERLKLSLHL